MLKKIIIALLVLIAVIVGVGAARGGQFRVERRIAIKADVARIHELCGDLENWAQWEPWREDDPTIVVTLGEKTTGVGAHQSWTGESGDGELTFTRCDPQAGITYDMAFIDGEHRTQSVALMNYRTLEPGSVEVSWVIEGELDMPVIGGYLAMAFDSMVGPSFERGLSKLKAACEKT